MESVEGNLALSASSLLCITYTEYIDKYQFVVKEWMMVIMRREDVKQFYEIL